MIDPMKSALSRRGLLGAAGLGLGAMYLDRARAAGRACAGPFTWIDFDEHPIPADKKLDPAWVRSLTARGEPEWVSGDALRFIGMPVGGICCGQLYLAGDGRLWLWDIFNTAPPEGFNSTQGPNYARPPESRSGAGHAVENGFALRVERDGAEVGRVRLDSTGVSGVRFLGQYPVGSVDYPLPSLGVEARLEAFSPFIPLDAEESGLPATIMRWTIRNTGAAPARVTLAGWLANACCVATAFREPLVRRNRAIRAEGFSLVQCSVELPPEDPNARAALREDRPLVDFESGTYEGWTVTGAAFGSRPRELSDIAAYQGDLNAQGRWVANSHESRNGEDVVAADAHRGTLTGPEFVIDRKHLRFRIGGGNHAGQTCVNLLVDGAPARTSTGRNNNRMHREAWDVADLEGRRARIQIVDGVAGPWGHVGADEFILSDSPRATPLVLEREPDFGTMAIAALGAGDTATLAVLGPGDPVLAVLDAPAIDEAAAPTPASPVAGVRSTLTLAPGERASIDFVIAWHFAGLWRDGEGWNAFGHLPESATLRRYYATRFADAASVVRHVAANARELVDRTLRWRETWRDSTLPHWLLERAIIPVDCAATNTCFRFDNGRFYGWEGNYCCPGTCQHVWQYGHALARLFPSLERSVREEVDFGLAFRESSGAIDYRAEAHRIVAHDGLAGTILRAYREHTMTPDGAFLGRRWERIRRSIEHLIAQDALEDGLLEGEQYNTLDASWWGPMAWISSLYIAALRAGEAMAGEVGDDAFAARCAAIAERGARSLVDQLYNGEYFVHRPDPGHPEANRTGDGCHIDQVFGQSMAFSVGLGRGARVVPREECLRALASLYRYNFAPDIGPYRDRMAAIIKGGRWYAMPGEGGLLMCTWPKGGADAATGKGGEAWAAGYFNECMNGFEHQVAGHMVWEGLVAEGLAVERMIHDRYAAARRNPYNEIECADHYARSMASYGVFLGACGFEHHGPGARIAFDPRVIDPAQPGRFRAPFTACEGWGIYDLTISPERAEHVVEVRYGRLRVVEFAGKPGSGGGVRVSIVGPGRDRIIPAGLAIRDGLAHVLLETPAIVGEGERLIISLGGA